MMRDGWPTKAKVEACDNLETLQRWYDDLPWAETEDESQLIDVLDDRLGKVRAEIESITYEVRQIREQFTNTDGPEDSEHDHWVTVAVLRGKTELKPGTKLRVVS